MSTSIYLSMTTRIRNPLNKQTFNRTFQKVVNQTKQFPNAHTTSFVRPFHAGTKSSATHNISKNIFYTNYGQRVFQNHVPKHFQYCRQQTTSFLQRASHAQRRTFSNKTSKNATTHKTEMENLSMWQKWIAPREMPPRKTFKWYLEMTLICTVFAITGTSTMGRFCPYIFYCLCNAMNAGHVHNLYAFRLTHSSLLSFLLYIITILHPIVLVRPAVSHGLGLQGSLKDGPWSYRICSLVIMTPLYSAMLVCVGTIFGRHHYFRHFAVKMFSRFGIPPELMDKTFHETAKNFRKW